MAHTTPLHLLAKLFLLHLEISSYLSHCLGSHVTFCSLFQAPEGEISPSMIPQAELTVLIKQDCKDCMILSSISISSLLDTLKLLDGKDHVCFQCLAQSMTLEAIRYA